MGIKNRRKICEEKHKRCLNQEIFILCKMDLTYFLKLIFLLIHCVCISMLLSVAQNTVLSSSYL